MRTPISIFIFMLLISPANGFSKELVLESTLTPHRQFRADARETTHIFDQVEIQRGPSRRYSWRSTRTGLLNAAFADTSIVYLTSSATGVTVIYQVIENYRYWIYDRQHRRIQTKDGISRDLLIGAFETVNHRLLLEALASVSKENLLTLTIQNWRGNRSISRAVFSNSKITIPASHREACESALLRQRELF